MERTLTVAMQLNLVQVVLMASFLLLDLLLKMTVDMVNMLAVLDLTKCIGVKGLERLGRKARTLF